MSEPKFSPEPWKAVSDQRWEAINIVDGNGQLFALVKGEANAALIAAAAELYRDLHEAVVEMCANCPSGKDCGREMCESTADCFVAKWKMTLEKARDNDLAGTVPAGNITSTERRDHEG